MESKDPMSQGTQQRNETASLLPSKSAEIAPDPEEDDLDDLDDMLDDFSATDINIKDNAPTSSGPGRPKGGEDPGAASAPFTEADFAKQLKAGMADLLGELDSSPEMQQQFESLAKELGQATASVPQVADPVPSTSRSGQEGSTADAEDSFQETIRRTMQRMQESGDQAGAAATTGDSDDILAQMLKEMQSGGLDGSGSEEDFSKVLMGMMEKLTNKEILYEPMKELHQKFPNWMEQYRDRVSKEDLERYTEQQNLVNEIVGKFEQRNYSDSNPADREFIVERMQKMQAAGSPPADLVGDMNAAQEALGDVDAGCPQQ